MKRRTRIATVALGLLVAAGAGAGSEAGTFAESNPLYHLKVTYSFEGDSVRHEVELTNRLEIQVSYGHVDSTLVCASGQRHAASFRVPDGDVPAGGTRRFHGESSGCSPAEKRDPATGRLVMVHDEIRGVDYSGRIEMAQHGVGFVGLTWDCGDEEIIVTAIKFPRGTGFRLVASNDRSMTARGEFDPVEAARHLCGGPVDDPLGVTAGIRKLIGEVRTFCETAPQFCDKAYDVNNRRAATATRG